MVKHFYQHHRRMMRVQDIPVSRLRRHKSVDVVVKNECQWQRCMYSSFRGVPNHPSKLDGAIKPVLLLLQKKNNNNTKERRWKRSQKAPNTARHPLFIHEHNDAMNYVLLYFSWAMNSPSRHRAQHRLKLYKNILYAINLVWVRCLVLCHSIVIVFINPFH